MNAPRIVCLLLAAVALSAPTLSAQVIFANTITGTNPNTSNPYTTGQTVDLNLTVSGIGRGTTITGSAANDRYAATGWNSGSLDANDYFTWTLTPASGYQLNLTSLVYTGQVSGTGPTSFAFRSGTDSFSANLGTPTATGASITLTSGSFQGLTGATEFRLYGWNASSASGTFSVNDFTFNGTLSASAIPEPSTYAAAAGAGALVFSYWRRRKQKAGPAGANGRPP